MANPRTYTRAFFGGELTREFFGQVTDVKYQNGLALCRNFICKPHGPVMNMAGTKFVKQAKENDDRVRLIPFQFSDTQTMVIEFGGGYFRFHTQGATLQYSAPAAWSNVTAYTTGNLVSRLGVNYYAIAASTNQAPPNATYWYALPGDMTYEIPNSYAENDIFNIHYVQSSDVMTLVHPSYAPKELRRYGATDWRLSDIAFQSSLSPPTGLSISSTGSGTNPNSYNYVVTSVGSLGIDESVQSSSVSTNNDLTGTNASNTISFTGASGAQAYNVYRTSGGIYGYVGQTTSTSFVDENITPDISKTPPISNNPFSGSGNYPAAVSYYEQRRWFGGTTNNPQGIWATKSGTESNMNYSLPIRDDDSIQQKIAGRENNGIRHIVPLNSLVLMTSSSEWRVTSVNSDAITALTISIKPQSYVGSSNVQPIIVNNTMLYIASRGGHARELTYNWQAQGLISGDLSLRAPHLFDDLEIVDMAYQKAPQPIIWYVSDNGKLLGVTYVPEQEIGAWHQHDTDGLYESICVVTEGVDEVLYAVVKRQINGSQRRYIERFQPRTFTELKDAYFVHSGLTYVGPPVTTLSGLDHLEAKEVSVIIDGAVASRETVSGGQISVSMPDSDEDLTVHVGLPIVAQLQTLPVAVNIPGLGQGRPKNVDKVWMRVEQSSSIKAGPAFDKLRQYKQRTNETPGAPPRLISDEIELTLTPTWGNSGQVCIEQSDPLPLTVVNLTLEVAMGG